ncbi:MAG TPA: hypothetical protein DCL41_00200 [Bdellovibrionales bacterium]|nr:hypothetical protein [Bdellovibrionales bacterium]
MKSTLLMLTVLILGTWGCPSLAQPLEQNSHYRILALTTNDEAEIHSLTLLDLERTQIGFCQNEDNTQTCLSTDPDRLTLRALQDSQDKVVSALNERLRQWTFLRKSWSARLGFRRTHPKQMDIVALQQMIDEISSQGLVHWVLLTKENQSSVPPLFSNQHALKEVFVTIKRALGGKQNRLLIPSS